MTVRPAPQPDRDSFQGDELAAYDWVIQREVNRGEADSQGKITPYYGAMLHSPEVTYHVSALGKWARLVGDNGDSFSHADREWVDQVLSQEIGSTMVVLGHMEDALYQGVRIEAVKAIWDEDDTALTDRELTLARYIRAVHRGETDDELYASVEKLLGTKGVIEYTMWILYLHLVIRAISAITGGSGPSLQTIKERIAGFADGTTPIPTEATYQAG